MCRGADGSERGEPQKVMPTSLYRSLVRAELEQRRGEPEEVNRAQHRIASGWVGEIVGEWEGVCG